MGARSKSGKIHGAARKSAATPQSRQGRGTVRDRDAWEQTAQVPEERYDEIDGQRIVQDDSGRTLPLYYDDYN